MDTIVLLDQKKEEVEEIKGGCEEEDNSGDEKEKENSEKEEDSGDDEEKEESEEEEGSGDDEEGSKEEEDGGEEKQEEMSQDLDKDKKSINLTVPPKEKKQTDVLNLNNEVVKMRKEVKRVRALIIRKLTRQIGALKKKKGKDAETEKNQRRADRLLGEIQAMKVLIPDLVTKTALQKNLNFEQVCKNPTSTISDRAIARIATHPQFNKKIENIKAAVKAFKEERLKAGKEGGKEKLQNQAVKMNPQSPDGKGGKKVEKEKDSTEQRQKWTDNKKGNCILKGSTEAIVAKPEMETVNYPCSDDTSDIPKKEMPQSESLKLLSVKSIQVKDVVKNKPQSKDREKKPAAPETRKDEEESDFELSDDEEKEYFDDSTEERFYKQSSQSEESDNDFFIGKVSKFKKKKENEQKSIAGDEKKHDVKNDMTSKVQSELDELEARLKSKATSLQSVFCSSLSGPKQTGGGDAGRGKGWEKFRGQRKMKGGPNRDYSRQSKFQRQDKGTESNSSLSYSKPEGSRPESEKGFATLGRGRGHVMKHKDHRGGHIFSHQAPQQALHPSWEASKKRKQQQGQILAFQGKKIKFDDDDDD